MIVKSTKEIQALLDAHEGASFKPSCPCCVSKLGGGEADGAKKEETKQSVAQVPTANQAE